MANSLIPMANNDAPRRKLPARLAVLRDSGANRPEIAAPIDATADSSNARRATALAPMSDSEMRLIADRVCADQLAVQVSEVSRRLDLRASVLFARHVCETRLAAEHLDSQIAALCSPIERLGADALCALRAIPDSRELVGADQAFLAMHSLPRDRDRHEIAAEMGRLAAPLLEYLRRNRDRIDGNLDQFTSSLKSH